MNMAWLIYISKYLEHSVYFCFLLPFAVLPDNPLVSGRTLADIALFCRDIPVRLYEVTYL